MNPEAPEFIPSTPKKRAAVKRTKEQLWLEAPLKLSHIRPDLDELQDRVNLLTGRLNSLETEWEQLLERLCEMADGMEDTEEEKN